MMVVPIIMAQGAPSFAAIDDRSDRHVAAKGRQEVALIESPESEHSQPIVPEGRFGPSESRSRRTRVAELTAERTATSDAWINSDGTRSIRTYASPRYFQPEGGAEWVPIETELVPDADRSGRVRSKANRWSVSFGAAGAADGMQRYELAGHIVTFSPIDADPTVGPVTKDSTATYADLWPATDAVYSVSPVGTDERLVLKSADAPTSFAFAVAGARLRKTSGGGIDLVVGGTVVASIPPLTVETARRAIDPAEVDAAFAVQNGRDGSSGVVTISISRQWLAALPTEAFPVVIDPTVTTATTATAGNSYRSSGPSESGTTKAGVDSSLQRWRGTAFVPIPDPAQTMPGGSQPWRLVSALMKVNRQTGSTGCVCSLTARASSLQPLTFAAVANGQPLQPVESGTSDFTFDVTSWVATHPGAGTWYGFIGDEDVTHGSNLHVLRGPGGNGISVEYFFFQSSDPTHLVSPSGTISTTTPRLTAQVVEPPDPDSAFDTVYYDFKISTEPNGAGMVIDSGWIESPTWTVPPGALADGMTYYVRVWDNIGVPWAPGAYGYFPPAEPTVVKALTIKKRLGAGGPSPTDTVGSVPGSTSTPSKGAPSPATGTASVTVNMMTRNLAVTVNTHPLSTLSGPAGVTLNYDSQRATGLDGGGRGLYGRYFSGGTLIGQRLDPSINFSWAGSPMGGVASPSTNVTAEWTGTITTPPAKGSWQLGGTVASGTMKIYLDGSSTAYKTVAAGATPSFGSSLAWPPASVHALRVEYSSAGAKAVQLWARDTGVLPATEPSQFVVPNTWLAPRATGLPAGWRLSANPYSGSWTRLEDFGSHAVLHSASGATALFTRRPDGSYSPPPGSNDMLTVATTTVSGLLTAGEFSLSTNDNFLFTFGRDGWVRSVRSVADDRHPTALQYTYATLPGTVGAPVLTTITDPVSSRSIGFCYGAANCDGGEHYGTSNAPAGMLARIDHWDGSGGSPSFSTLVYDGSGRLARIENPSGTADFGYDSSGRLNQIRDPLANDVLAYNRRPTDCPNTAASTPECATVINYLPNGLVSSVVQPAPTSGAARPRRTYAWDETNRKAWVKVDGFAPTSGYANRVEWDEQGRVVKQEDAVGRTTHTLWDPNIDRPLRTVDSAGLQTVDVYDAFTNLLTDKYGPAPSSCFSSAFPYTPAGACPVIVPRTQHRYDEGMNALAATFWDNPWFAGAPKSHGTGPGGTGPGGPGCSANTLCTQWNTLPVTPSGVTRPSCCSWTTSSPFTWSMRLSGIINLPAPSQLMAATTQRVMVYVDGALHYDMDAPVSNEDYTGNYGEWWAGVWPNPPAIPAGRHRIQIDFLGSSTTLNGLWFYGAGTSFLSSSLLSPDYGLETTSIDPDGVTVATSYSGAGGIGPELGLPTTVTQDPGGLNLTTTTAYESPGSGRWLRKTALTLPAGNTTNYMHYCSRPGAPDCGSDQYPGAIASACGVTAGAPQHGLLAQQIEPDVSPAAQGRAQQFLYDPAGRVVGRRVGRAETIADAPWQCSTHDLRGRLTSQSWPALGASIPGRTVTYSYLDGGSPLSTSVTDTNGTVSSTVDLLGRPVTYTDAVGRTTYYYYDQVGRLTRTAGPQNVISQSYNVDSSQLDRVVVYERGGGNLSASIGYEPTTGRMTSVAYSAVSGHQMNLAVGYDAYGNQTGLTFTNVGGSGPARIAGHQVTMSPGGRQRNTLVETGATSLVDPNPTGDDFVYDGAGRLVTAHLNGGRADYGYGQVPATDTCTTLHAGSNANAGRNTNRTILTWTPTAGAATSTYSCFNTADQLVATIVDGVASDAYRYDERGNQRTDGLDTYGWDSADRLTSITAPGSGTVSYTRDALDRAMRRSDGTSTTHYAYSGFSDTPVAVLDADYNIVQELFHLPGGVLVTVENTTFTNTWSFPNLAGHHVTTTADSGVRLGSVVTYDPWGAEHPSGTTVDNVSGAADLAAYGSHGKLEERAATKPLVLMGSRPFLPTRGRFLSVDPVEGGCANAYVYVYGDPVNRPVAQ